MHDLAIQIPKLGIIVQVFVYTDPLKPTVYIGTVIERSNDAFTLGGLYENAALLKGCYESGRFMPMKCLAMRFPKKTVLQHKWKTVRAPNSTGQYFVYDGNVAPIPTTILSVNDFTASPRCTRLICLIGAEHVLFANTLTELNHEFFKAGITVYPELTNDIYKETIAKAKAMFQMHVLKSVLDKRHS
jgi:hypothetical protein